MVFPLDNIHLGPQTFGPRKGHLGVVWHTTESDGQDLAAAHGIAEWQKRNPGSYNFLIATDGTLLTVPYLEAAGGLNPASRSWAPQRFPRLKQGLSAAAYANPNAYLLNVAFVGRAGDLDPAWPKTMIDQAARLVIWFEDSEWGADDAFLCTHADWQTNRSDPGRNLIPAVLARYGELRNPTVPPPSREERIATEVTALRSAFPEAAARWVTNTGMTQDIDGQPLTRERRLSAEVTFLREVAAG